MNEDDLGLDGFVNVDELKSVDDDDGPITDTITDGVASETTNDSTVDIPPSTSVYESRYRQLKDVPSRHKTPDHIMNEINTYTKSLIPPPKPKVDVSQFLIDESVNTIPVSEAFKDTSSTIPHMFLHDEPTQPTPTRRYTMTSHTTIASRPPSRSNITVSVDLPSIPSMSAIMSTSADLISKIPGVDSACSYVSDKVSDIVYSIPGRRTMTKLIRFAKKPFKMYKNYKNSLSYNDDR